MPERCTTLSKTTLANIAKSIDTQFGCPVPGYKPGVGYITQGPGVTTKYAEPYQAEGETTWSLPYDLTTKTALDEAGLTPIKDDVGTQEPKT